MELFLDTAKIDEVKKGFESECIDGVTTNPTLIEKAEMNFEETILQIAKLAEKSKKQWAVSAEVTQTETAPIMVEQGIKLANLHKNVVIKVPMTLEGIKATSILCTKGVRTNVTLCFSVTQALLAAKAGATYVSPFIGRFDDIGENGVELISKIRKVYDNYNFKTKILAASIRSPLHVAQVAEIGTDVATIPFNVFEKMYTHPLTDNGLKKFNDDWQTYLQKKI